MKKLMFVAVILFSHVAFSQDAGVSKSGPEYTADTETQLKFPKQYREWIYLSTGIDMAYFPRAGTAENHMFTSVFVNPEAYRAFMNTGTWPDKTMLVLEGRHAETTEVINKSGEYQGGVTGVEAHVKDEKRFPGKWAFFVFSNQDSAKMLPPSAPCYSCHDDHAAVDKTFVQFYPTLMEVARKKGTLSPAYLKENPAGPAK